MTFTNRLRGEQEVTRGQRRANSVSVSRHDKKSRDKGKGKESTEEGGEERVREFLSLGFFKFIVGRVIT